MLSNLKRWKRFWSILLLFNHIDYSIALCSKDHMCMHIFTYWKLNVKQRKGYSHIGPALAKSWEYQNENARPYGIITNSGKLWRLNALLYARGNAKNDDYKTNT